MIFQNFITVMKRYTSSSILNIAGLGIAFASAYLILVQVCFDLSYNRNIGNAENIYRLEYPSRYREGFYSAHWNRQQPAEMAESVPEIEAIAAAFMAGWDHDASIKRNATIDNMSLKLAPAEEAVFDVFGLDVVAGSVENFGENHLALRESAARKYGLDVGDVLHWGKGAEEGAGTVTVCAVYRDLRGPSAIASTDGFTGMAPAREADRSNWNTPCYIRLADGASPEAAAAKMLDDMVAEAEKEGASQEDIDKLRKRMAVRLHSLRDIYFARDVDGADGLVGNRATTMTLLGIACLVIAVAFINFVNFFFALIPVRIRSVNTRKIFGASSRGLRLGFVVETAGLVAAALAVAYCLVLVFADTPLADYISASVAVGDNLPVALWLAGGALAAGVVVSIYPAWYITSFSPAFVIKGSFSATSSGHALRYTLVGIQYVISISLIVAALFMRLQHSYMMNYDMGFDSSMVLAVDNVQLPNHDKFKSLADKLKENPVVTEVAVAAGNLVAPERMGWGRGFKDKQINFQCYPVSWNLLDMMGIKVVEGRDFNESDEAYEKGTFIFNDTARRRFELTLDDQVYGHLGETRIAGFCEDFNFKPLQYGIEPFAFYVFGRDVWSYPSHLYVRIAAGADIRAARRYVETTVLEMLPYLDSAKVEAYLFDAELEAQYQKERRLSTLITIFSALSIIISMMGVFGLVLFETQYRRKEIGIRRVNGATVGSILWMFNVQFLRVVAVCAVIAVPVSWYFVDRWLSTFAYRMPMHWWVFAAAIAAVAAVTSVTVTARSRAAANENPVNAIQH